MEYKFSELHKLNNEFYAIFGVCFKPFYDGLMSVMSRHLCIDMPKFDDWLHEIIGDYENKGLGMNDAIRAHYGEKGVKLINALI